MGIINGLGGGMNINVIIASKFFNTFGAKAGDMQPMSKSSYSIWSLLFVKGSEKYRKTYLSNQSPKMRRWMSLEIFDK